jgi:2-keto-4-pentenoate hydratase/2-oxohepta-3-ene-1,7-dioic acid hydratase in catechol pathway
MRLANLDGRSTIVLPEGGLDVEHATKGAFSSDPLEAIERIDELAALSPSLDGPLQMLTQGLLRAPSPRPTQMMAIGMNFHSHAAEMGLEVSKIPALFTKFRSALGAPFGEISLPSGTVDYEVELVVIIKKRTFKVAAEDAWDHVAGLCVGQDLSDRAVQMGAGRQFSLGKSYPGFAPFGPWISTLDEFADPNDVRIACSVDGVTVQDARTTDMVFPIPEALAQISSVIELFPGDVLYTGSPAGAGQGHTPPRYLKPGQELVTWAESIGEMSHQLVSG